ncbi:type IV toxin-antitoxin system AbiEi family antitoxin [Longimicrobium sp.]|uniref:type IV toxin-antitoxin system AbiEi family antitoxin n=1 Tax=Longimicrobium sp. TaxID=2029185 RepID=UPI002E3101E8|nr:type IV toxin-antitoxin system AbiEi family antitoxin [Longimicrobium sp.]HEX6042704.1 type IV toxin-antitoxin system AbiEi family antitoxin [Longimicrobium sp.]
MTKTGNDLSAPVRKAVGILEQALGGKARVQAEPARDGEASVVLKRAANLSTRFIVREWSGAPARVRVKTRVLWVLRSADEQVVMGMRKREESFVDLDGAVHLVTPWLLVDREGIEVPRPPAVPAVGNPFSDRNSLLVRALLDQPERAWGIRELAAEAGVSPGTASKVVRRLALEGLAEAPAGRAPVRILDPRALLRRWARAYDWQRNEMAAFHAPIGDVARFLKRLPGVFGDRRWALTLHAGASRVAPHASWERVHAYVGAESAAELYQIAHREGWPPADDGRLVLIKPYYRHSVWQGVRVVDGLPVVSDTQLVLDLWHYPLRGIEQAEHILAARGLGN